MASKNKLYPPIINGVLPAFYKRTLSNTDTSTWTVKIVIPFSMSKMVDKGSVASIFLRLKTVQTNEIKYCAPTNDFNLDEGVATFYLNEEEGNELVEGLFYKAQLAYSSESLSNTNVPSVLNAGYFSTVGIIKCISKPTVKIANLNPNQVNLFNNLFIGTYEQDIQKGDSNEKVYSYCFTITDKNDNIYYTTGTQLHNVNNDITYYSSEDEFRMYKLLPDNEIYYLKYTVTTINNLVISSPAYRIMMGESIDMEKIISVLPELNYDEGYIQINFKGPSSSILINGYSLETTPEERCSGLFLLSRGYKRDDYIIWEDIARFSLMNEYPSEHSEYDFTIEQGVTYQYRLQQYNLHGVYSNPVYSNEIYADFEDMFLYDGVRQLKVRFNPKVSSFKVNIPEQKLETIGSKYPFIFRNGNVYYHEFPISGLISYQLDEAKLFLNEDEIADGQILENNFSYNKFTSKVANKNILQHEFRSLTEEEWEKLSDKERLQRTQSNRKISLTTQEVKQTLNDNITSPIRFDKDLTSENLMSERYFKLKVLEWLTNGEIKLFRSPGEGNYLVRLLNTSMTPNDTLGRMLHTFNTTAYEIAELTYDNLLAYHMISVAQPEKTLIQYQTILLNPRTDSIVYTPTTDEVLMGIEFIDWMPGDKIIISYADDLSTETIVIGSTGYYYFNSYGRPITDITFEPISRTESTYPRTVNIGYIGEQQHYFDVVTNVNTTTIVGRTYYGPQNNLVNILTSDDLNFMWKFNIPIGKYTESYKTKLLDLELLKVKRREIIPIYEVGTNLYATTPFGVGRPLNELKELNETGLSFLSKFAIFAIYTPVEHPQIDMDHIDPISIENNLPQDYLYNQLYPEWEFAYYIDSINNTRYSKDELYTRFAITITNSELNYIELQDEPEIVLSHLGPIDMLYLSNGVMAEVTMRIQVLTYTLESEADLAQKQKAYLNAQKTFETQLDNYYTNANNAEQNYMTYLTQLGNYEANYNRKQALDNMILVVNAIINSPRLQEEYAANLKDTARSKINEYINTFWDNVNAGDLPAPTGWNAGTKPPTVNTTTVKNELILVDENNTTNINLSYILNLANTTYLNLLANYQSSIPEDISNALWPDGWTSSYIGTHTVPQLVTELSTFVVTLLNTMYNQLRFNTSPIVNIFNSEYYMYKLEQPIEVWTTQQWTVDMANSVRADQIEVAGLLETLYDDLFGDSERILMTKNKYDLTCSILQAYLKYEEDSAKLQGYINAKDNLELTSNWSQLQIDYQNLVAIPVAEQQQIHDDAKADQLVQQSQWERFEQILQELESGEIIDADPRAIDYCTAAINIAHMQWNVDADIMARALDQIDEINTEYESLITDYNNTLNTLTTLNDKIDNFTTRKLPDDLSSIQVELNAWNMSLNKVVLYIEMLQQIEELQRSGITQAQLQEYFARYEATYQQLKSLHDSLYTIASDALENAKTMDTGIAALTALRDGWQAELDAIGTLIEPVEPRHPDPFDYQNIYSNPIRAAWERYIQALRIEYQKFEARYYYYARSNA